MHGRTASAAFEAYDPSATLAVHCGNGFDAGFSPYQSTRLSRYNAGLLSLGADMRRREFITLLGGAAAAWPLAARAQQPAMPVIGFLSSASPAGAYGLMAAAFRQGLSETGYVEGRNVAIEYRWAEGQYDRLPALAADLVRRQVAVIAAQARRRHSPPRAATTTIPIVFTTATDPVKIGLVASLNRPGGNVTGVSNLGHGAGAKAAGTAARDGAPATIVGSARQSDQSRFRRSNARDLEAAARTLGLELDVLHASTERDLDGVFATMVQLRAGALVVAPDTFFYSRQRADRSHWPLATRCPPIYPWRECCRGRRPDELWNAALQMAYRQAGIYVGRILKGEKPADLPVEQPTKFELVINLKTAKALGLDVPLDAARRADEVIE